MVSAEFFSFYFVLVVCSFSFLGDVCVCFLFVCFYVIYSLAVFSSTQSLNTAEVGVINYIRVGVSSTHRGSSTAFYNMWLLRSASSRRE